MPRPTPVSPARCGAVALLALACIPSDNIPDAVENGALVATQYDAAVAFGSYRTFDIASAVAVVDDAGTSYVVSAPITAEIAAMLEQRGYVKGRDIDPTSPPGTSTSDLAVIVSVLKATSGQYPCDWPPWWGFAGYGCHYPWAWVAPYTSGTLLVEVADLANAPAAGSGDVTVVWAALAYGILPDLPLATGAAVGAIDWAFAQSPYLHSP